MCCLVSIGFIFIAMNKFNVMLSILLPMLVLVSANDDCGVIPMTEWSGEDSRRTDLLHRPVNLAVVQHTVTRNCNTDAECTDVARGIRSYHLRKGFDDIGMSFLIGGNGRVYEGAGWEKVGAHTRGYNDKSVSISFIGNFSDKLPTTKSLEAAKDLLSCGIEMGYLTEDYKVVGQRQLSSTLSPGEALQKHIETWSHWSN